MLALSALEDWYIEALDVKTAFLYGKLDEKIYMHQPEGFKLKGQEHKVLRLHRALYGLKQVTLSWWMLRLDHSSNNEELSQSFIVLSNPNPKAALVQS